MKAAVIALASLEWTGIAQANLENTYHGKNVPHSTVLPGDTLHIGQVGMPLSIDSSHIGVVPGEPTARRLVERIGLLAP